MSLPNSFTIAPDTMVQGLQLQAIQPTEVYLEWQTMKETDFNGYPKGYVIRYRSYSESTYNEKLVEYGSISDTIKGLTPFTIHIFELMAYTAAGRGPPVAKVIKTLEGRKCYLNFHLLSHLSKQAEESGSSDL